MKVKCKACNGKGVVNWSSIYGVNPPQMTGEIRIEEISICALCRGCGMNKPSVAIERVAISVEEWYSINHVSVS